MSSGFVSGGTNDEPIVRDDEWKKAQAEIEENHRRREQERAPGQDKSLYEVLQNNKAAKQEAFEESAKLKNQFRTLDEDEVEFLDSVLESTRQREADIQKETSQQLEAFRRNRDELDKSILDEATDVHGKKTELDSTTPGVQDEWKIGNRKRKRKRDKEGGEVKSFEPRKKESLSSPTNHSSPPKALGNTEKPESGLASSKDAPGKEGHGTTDSPVQRASEGKAAGKAVGLVAYDSGDSD